MNQADFTDCFVSIIMVTLIFILFWDRHLLQDSVFKAGSYLTLHELDSEMEWLEGDTGFREAIVQSTVN